LSRYRIWLFFTFLLRFCFCWRFAVPVAVLAAVLASGVLYLAALLLLAYRYLVLLLVCDVPGMSAVTCGLDVALKSRLFQPLFASLLLAYRTFCCLCPCCFYNSHAVVAVYDCCWRFVAVALSIPVVLAFFTLQNKTETRNNFAILHFFDRCNDCYHKVTLRFFIGIFFLLTP
jgi:hypothetical protein